MLTWGKTMVDFAARLIQLRNHEHHLLQLQLGHQHQQQLRHPRQYLCHPTAKRCNLMERLCETRCLLTTVTLENNACPAKLGLKSLASMISARKVKPVSKDLKRWIAGPWKNWPKVFLLPWRSANRVASSPIVYPIPSHPTRATDSFQKR